ncbi:hypothetical protein, partial [Pseudodonghicola xiamenensis]
RCEPRKQAGHKTASEKVHEIIYDLLCGSHPHRTVGTSCEGANLGVSAAAAAVELVRAFMVEVLKCF